MLALLQTGCGGAVSSTGSTGTGGAGGSTGGSGSGGSGSGGSGSGGSGSGGPEVTGTHVPLRTRYLRTNSFYDSGGLQLAPPHFTVYDPAHRQFFISNAYLNEIDVFDAAQEIQTATISVPQAWGLDISPIDGSLWAGTMVGDLYNIDTKTLTVIKRYAEPSIGPSGFGAQTALVLSDGRLALQGGAGGILGVDGFGSIVVWNPATNAMDSGTQYGSVCPYTNGGFSLSGDRKLILNTTVDEETTNQLCSYDPVAKQVTYGSLPSQDGTFVRQIIPTPDGTKFFLTTNLDGVIEFDAKTLQVVGSIPGGSGLTFPNGVASGVMSLDGKTIYLSDQMIGGIVGYDTTTYKAKISLAHPTVNDSQSSMLPAAIDETGLIAGPIGHGAGFADAAAPMPQIADKGFYPVFATPDTSPLSGGTAITIGEQNSGLLQFYVGNLAVTGASMDSSNHLNATVPAASSGMAVDLTTTFTDGTLAITPEGFSYGPVIVEIVPNGATAEGGQTGAVIAYGLGTSTTGVQVIIGGQVATVQKLYTSAPISPYPFDVETLTFTIPPGITGSADVTVTSPSGTTTVKGGFHYVAASQSFPLDGTLQEGIYDQQRDLYYFTDTNSIQVLSRSQGKWLTPISLPGTTSKTQLYGLAESPSGNFLAVADYGDLAIYTLNPGTPSVVNRYPMPPDYLTESLSAPSGVAVLDSGKVYITANDIGGTGEPALWKLDPATKTISKLGSVTSGANLDVYDRLILSPDASRVYGEVEGVTFTVNTATDAFQYASRTNSGDGGQPDLAVSADGSTVEINGYLTDGSLNVENLPGFVDWETWLPSAVVGQKLNHDGSLLFWPLSDGIDIVARNTGRLLFRVQIAGGVKDVYDALLTTGDTNTIGVITPTGVSFVDLSSLPLPMATPFPAPSPLLQVPDQAPLVTSTDERVRNNATGAKRRSALRRYSGANRTAWDLTSAAND